MSLGAPVLVNRPDAILQNIFIIEAHVWTDLGRNPNFVVVAFDLRFPSRCLDSMDTESRTDKEVELRIPGVERSITTIVLTIVLLSALVFGVSAPATAATELVGLVKLVKKDAFGTPPGTVREKKFRRFPIVQDELLETGGGAGMLVEFLDETTLTLGADASLVIDTFVYDPATATVTTLGGNAAVHFRQGWPSHNANRHPDRGDRDSRQ